MRHEFGHIPQLMILGVGKFGLTVGLPSYQEWGEKLWGGYYFSPWEAMAEMFGGANNGGRELTKAEKSRAIKYLVASFFVGPFVHGFYKNI